MATVSSWIIVQFHGKCFRNTFEHHNVFHISFLVFCVLVKHKACTICLFYGRWCLSKRCALWSWCVMNILAGSHRHSIWYIRVYTLLQDSLRFSFFHSFFLYLHCTFQHISSRTSSTMICTQVFPTHFLMQMNENDCVFMSCSLNVFFSSSQSMRFCMNRT